MSDAELKDKLREKHLRIMKQRRDFASIFGVDVKLFYDNILVGFDVVKFDYWLRENVEAYDEDKESMSAFIARKYGQKAADMVRSFI